MSKGNNEEHGSGFIVIIFVISLRDAFKSHQAQHLFSLNCYCAVADKVSAALVLLVVLSVSCDPDPDVTPKRQT